MYILIIYYEYIIKVHTYDASFDNIYHLKMCSFLDDAFILTLSTPHATEVAISRLVEKVPSQELLHATEFRMRLVW